MKAMLATLLLVMVSANAYAEVLTQAEAHQAVTEIVHSGEWVAESFTCPGGGLLV